MASGDERDIADSGADVAPSRWPRFFASRLAGQVSAARLFWFDMMLVGSAINLAALFVSLMALGFHVPIWAAIVIHALPVPYNLFLFACLWRAARTAEPATSSAARMAGAVWLAAFVLI